MSLSLHYWRPNTQLHKHYHPTSNPPHAPSTSTKHSFDHRGKETPTTWEVADYKLGCLHSRSKKKTEKYHCSRIRMSSILCCVFQSFYTSWLSLSLWVRGQRCVAFHMHKEFQLFPIGNNAESPFLSPPLPLSPSAPLPLAERQCMCAKAKTNMCLFSQLHRTRRSISTEMFSGGEGRRGEVFLVKKHWKMYATKTKNGY